MQTIKLNLIPQGVNPTCYSSQYDTGRVIRVLLFEGVTPYTLSNSESVSLSVRKPDNTLVTTSVTNTEAEYVDIVTTEQMTAVTGINICELKISEGSKVIGSLNFNMQVELDPTAHGIPSGSALDNLQEQVDSCVENSLERLYDGSSVSFDSEPTASHNAPYTVTSAGIKTALDTKANSSDLNNYYNKTQVDNALGNLTASDIGYDNTNTGLTSDKVQGAIDEVLAQVPLNATGLSYSNTQSGLQSNNVQGAIDELAGESTDVSYTSNQNSGNKIGDITIDGVTTSLYTGDISSVGTLDDLNDVDTTGKSDGDSLRYDANGNEWVAKPVTVALTQAEYDALVLSGDLAPNTHYVITDAPNLNPTASDIEYSSGVTVYDAIPIFDSNTLSGGTNITVNRSQVYKYGKLAFVTCVFTTTANITGDSTVLNLPTGYSAKNFTDIVGSDNSGNTKLLYASGSTIKNNGALTSGAVVFLNATYQLA